VEVGHDSNIFSEANAQSDTIVKSSVGAELVRRRGIIAVDATASLDYVHYGRFTEQTGWHPGFRADFDKSSGRTTGKLSVHAYRTNRAETAVNIRTTSWNVPVELSIKYPVNEKLYLTSDTGFLRRTYSRDRTLVDYTDYSQGVDAFYVYNSRIDLLAGYRVRLSETRLGQAQDHGLSIGATGGLLPKVNGTLRLGYQWRDQSGSFGDSQHGQFTVFSALTWLPTRKLNFSLQAGRDYITTAIGSTVDTLGLSLLGTYSFNRRLDLEAGVSYGRNLFVDQGAARREDDFVSWNAGATYTFSERLKLGANYQHHTNWSTLSFSDFERTNFSFEVSSRF
jgi:hypothetical protein